MEITEIMTKWKTFPLASKQNKQEKKNYKVDCNFYLRGYANKKHI